jgi:hypothetical protein
VARKAVEYFLKKYLVPSGGVVTLISFWGEQKPVVAIAATGFIFSGVRGFSSFPQRISSASIGSNAVFIFKSQSNPRKNFVL